MSDLNESSGGNDQSQAEGNNRQQAHYNIKDDPNVRRLEANYQRKQAELEKRLREAEERAAQSQRQMQSVMNVVTAANPDVGQELVREAQLLEQQEELARLRAEKAEREAMDSDRQWHISVAEAAGYDTSDPRFVNALEQTLRSGDGSIVERAKRQMAMEAQQPAPPARQQQEPQPQRETSEPDVMLPPTGGTSSPSTNQELRDTLKKYYDEMAVANTRNNQSEKYAIRRKYRKIFRERFSLDDIPG